MFRPVLPVQLRDNLHHDPRDGVSDNRRCVKVISRRCAGASLIALALFTAVACSPSGDHPTGRLPLRSVRDVNLPGRPTRFDYQSVDPVARRLYLAHLGDNEVVVVDLDTLRPVARIGSIRSVHGVVAFPELGRAFATATGTDQVVAIDTVRDRIIGRARTGSFPDGLAVDVRDGLLLISNKDEGTETVVDATTLAPRGTVKLGHEAGNVAFDDATGWAWAAVSRPDQLVAFDPSTRLVTRRVPLRGCAGAHGVYLGSARRAFVACERNARLVTIDLARSKAVATVAVGQDPDVLAADPTSGRLYVAAESGTVSVLSTRRTVRVLARAHLADYAHSVAVDPRSHRLFFPLQNVGGRPVLRVMAPTG